MIRRLLKRVAALSCVIFIGSGTHTSAAPPETRSAPSYGYILMDAATGHVISHENADNLFIPASLSKIPTTLMALSNLGAERRFRTRLLAEGTVINGVLQGNLHLVGSGDPSLKERDVIELVAKLSAAGVHRVSGRFTYDTSALPRSASIDAAQPAGQAYNPPVSGLNVDLNLSGKNGRSGPAREPGRRAGRMLRYFAHGQGITLPEPTRLRRAATGYEIAVHTSAPVATLAAEMMDLSTNLAAESLGMLSVASMGTQPKSLSGAAKATAAWVKAEAGVIGGAGWRGFRMANHSGLSTKSRATPRQIASILRLGYQRFGRNFSDLHSANQPVGFQAYTLRGKFGTMRFVRGYAGFLTVGNKEMVFAIMANDRRRRALADAGTTGLSSQSWMNAARKLEQKVLGDWITGLWPSDRPATILTASAPAAIPAEAPVFENAVNPAKTILDAWDIARSEPEQPVRVSVLSAKPARYVRTTRLVK